MLPLDPVHAVPVEFLPVLETGERDGVGQEFGFIEGMGDIERDAVADDPAGHPEDGVPTQFPAACPGLAAPTPCFSYSRMAALMAACRPSRSSRSRMASSSPRLRGNGMRTASISQAEAAMFIKAR